MGKKEQHQSSALSNNLDIYPEEEYNPDFDLDAYINKQIQRERNSNTKPMRSKENSSFFKNAAVITLVIVMGFFWYHNWSIPETWASLFGGNEVTVSVNPNPNISVPVPPAPPAPPTDIPVPPNVSMDGYADYQSAVNNAGLQEKFSNVGVMALYQTDVPINYLIALQDGGYLDDLSYPTIIGLHSAGVTIDYLSQLSANNFADKFSTTAIIAMYSAGVPVDYLVELRDKKQLDSKGYSEIIAAYNMDH
jgi:hypothetical protein